MPESKIAMFGKGVPMRSHPKPLEGERKVRKGDGM